VIQFAFCLSRTNLFRLSAYHAQPASRKLKLKLPSTGRGDGFRHSSSSAESRREEGSRTANRTPAAAGGGKARDFAPLRRLRRNVSQVAVCEWFASTAQTARLLEICAVLFIVCAVASFWLRINVTPIVRADLDEPE
jgi:hypothetical protein